MLTPFKLKLTYVPFVFEFWVTLPQSVKGMSLSASGYKISLGQDSRGQPTSCPLCSSLCPALCCDLLCLTVPTHCLLGVHQHLPAPQMGAVPHQEPGQSPRNLSSSCPVYSPLNPDVLTFLTCLNTGYLHSVTHPASWQYCFEMLFTRSKVISVLLSKEQSGLLI